MSSTQPVRLVTIVSCFFFLWQPGASAQSPLYKSPEFTIFPNQVIQDKFRADVISGKRMTSNYQSPANLFQSSTISFKFAINGKDNEMLPGQDHHFTIIPVNGNAETPVIKFGRPLNRTQRNAAYLPPETRLHIRLDFRDVLNQFKQKGFYTTYNGTRIYQADFKGVYIAGGSLPMTWDFDNLVHHDELQLRDPDGDGIYETELLMNVKQDQKQTDAEWSQQKDGTAFPAYQSPYTISTALYNLSIEEMIKAVEPDSTFRTGKEWAGVWTRDISYSIILSMAYLQPRVAMNSLLKKVNNKKRIIQDTGTGGAYPNSTDRMIWAVAAWEVYKATGDENWLRTAYEVVKNSIDDDMQNVYDAETGMVKGESSFLDWRDQTYPKWMQPADIFESECLGTNAVHYEANIVLSEMAALLNQPGVASLHREAARKIREGINTYLWLPQQGYYAQYLYGSHYKIVSPRSEALGEALCVLFGIADDARAAQVIASTPVTAFGIPCIFPQIPNIPPYHNNAVWPFVQSYWALASAKVKSARSVLECLADVYRPAALFLTNKENFVADNGDFAGTQINSSNMLWSLSGNIALVHKILFGIEFDPDKLLFHPFIPLELNGHHVLSNFHYRNAILNIEIDGYGEQVSEFTIDGKLQDAAEVPAALTGNHSIRIILKPKPANTRGINKVPNYTSLPAPNASTHNGKLTWIKIQDAVMYRVLRNGKEYMQTTELETTLDATSYGEYQVEAMDRNGVSSFASEPVIVLPGHDMQLYQLEDYAPASHAPYKGFIGAGFVEISTTVNKIISMPVKISEAGQYLIDFSYANGNGPTNTENKCAIRSLSIDGVKAGTIIFPQRGVNEWNNWDLTNAVRVTLAKGTHEFILSYEPYNENMNGTVNQAMVDYLKLIRE